jgi:hypothetical protein
MIDGGDHVITMYQLEALVGHKRPHGRRFLKSGHGNTGDAQDDPACSGLTQDLFSGDFTLGIDIDGALHMAHDHRRWFLTSVAISADRGAKHQRCLGGQLFEGADELACPLHVDSEGPGPVALTCRREERGQMDDRRNPVDGWPHGLSVGDISLDHLNAVLAFKSSIIHTREIKHTHRTPIASQS